MASITDKITDVRNSIRPVTARVTVARASGAATLTCDALTGWPTASKVHFVTYQTDTNGDPVASTQIDCSGIVSGSSLTQVSVLDGTDAGNTIGDVVEMLPTASWAQDLSDALGVSLDRTGALLASIVTTAKINDSAVTTAKIADGTIAFGDLLSTIFSSQVTSYANAGTAGGTFYYINLGGIKLLWGVTGSITTTPGNSVSKTITLPSSFFTTIQTVVNSWNPNADERNVASFTVVTTSSLTIDVYNASGGTGGINGGYILVIGT